MNKELYEKSKTEYQDNNEIEISIPQLLHIMKQRKIWAILFFGVAMIIAIIYLLVTDPTYSAKASAMVEPIKSSASVEDMLSVGTGTSKIDTEVQLITSNANLYSALQKLDLTKYKDPDGVLYSEKDFLTSITSGTFKKKVSVTTVTNTKIIEISVKDVNAKFCADYANAVLATYDEMLTTIAKDSKSSQVEFLETQIPETEALLKQASLKLSEYKENSGIDQMSQKNTLLTNRIAMFQLEIEPLKLQLLENKSLMDVLNPDGMLPSVETISSDPEISGSIEDYISNSQELILYNSVEDSSDKQARKFVLESAISSKSKTILNAVTAIVGMSESSYAKVVSDYLCVSAYIQAIENVIDIYNQELVDYPIMERTLLELQRNVQIYEQLLLSLRTLLEETKMIEAAVVGNVTIVDEATVPVSPIAPRKARILAIATLAGIVAGFGFGFVLELMDNSIRDEETARRVLGNDVPSLGWTPYVLVEKNDIDIPGLFVLNEPDSNIAEKFRMVANNILYSVPTKVQVLSINSINLSEGKTTTICNVAASYAMSGKKVLLIDGDFRHSSIESFFNLKKSKQGFVDIIIDDVPLENVVIKATDKIPNLDILPPGKGTINPNALYNSDKMDKLFEKLKTYYDHIIIDSPPLSYGSEFTHIARHLDGFVINIRAGVSLKGALANFVKDLSFINAPLLGFVYYGVISKNQSSYDSYGYYGTYGRYGYGKYGYSKYGYYSHKKETSIYKEALGSYKKHYETELEKRNKVREGVFEPKKAFSNGKMTVRKPSEKADSPNKESTEKQKTMDMLSEIEKLDERK